ncbi:MAG: rod shape-determining protein MreC [Patescibacteria group bacterium]
MGRPQLIAILIVIAVTAAVAPASVGLNIKRSGQRVVTPLTRPFAQGYASVASFFHAIAILGSIIPQSNDLKRENLQLQARLSELEEVVRENDTLRRELAAREAAKERKFLSAQVVGHSSVKFVPELVIDRGARDGVAHYQPVLVAGQLIGVVVDAGETTATVRLITAHNSVVPVILANSRATGLLRGGLRGLVVEDLPTDVEVHPGEPVVTEKISPFEYKGIQVGTMEKVVSSQSEIFQVVSVNSPIDFTTISFVTVVIQ